MGTLLVDTLQNTSGGPLLGWTLLTETTASGESTIDVLGLTNEYAMYKFIWNGLQPTLDSSTDLWVRTDSDNGVSFDAGTSDYSWGVHRISFEFIPDHVIQNDTSDSQIQINGDDSLGENPNELMDLELTLFNPSGTEYTKFKWETTYFENGKDGEHISGFGMRKSAADVDAVRFLYSAGNIAVGTLKVYGVRK